MSRHDALAFCPHVGIASGPVIVGYVGTPLRYSASVFGAAVAMAARCAGVKPPQLTAGDADFFASSWVTFPSVEWGERTLQDIVGADEDRFELSEPFLFTPKNLPDCEVQQVVNRGLWLPTEAAEDRARASLSFLKRANRYWPEHL